MDIKNCNICLHDKVVSAFHRNKNECKKCKSKKDAKRRAKTTLALFEYKGGRCEHCWVRNIAHLEIYEYHHKDPEAKLMNVGANIFVGKTTLYEEADKCLLLCANCHKIEHARINTEKRNEN